MARLRLNGKRDRRFRIFNRVVNDWRTFVAQRVACLRLFQLHARDDVAGMCFSHLVELFTLSNVQRAKTFY